MVSPATWQPAISVLWVFDPGLQQPTPVLSDQPEPTAQPQSSVCVDIGCPVAGGGVDVVGV